MSQIASGVSGETMSGQVPCGPGEQENGAGLETLGRDREEQFGTDAF